MKYDSNGLSLTFDDCEPLPIDDRFMCGSFPFDTDVKVQAVRVVDDTGHDAPRTYLIVTAPAAGMNWLVDPSAPAQPMCCCYGCDTLSAVRRMVSALMKLGEGEPTGDNATPEPLPVPPRSELSADGDSTKWVDGLPERSVVPHDRVRKAIGQFNRHGVVWNVYEDVDSIMFKTRL